LGRRWRAKICCDVTATDESTERQYRAGVRGLIVLSYEFYRLAENPAGTVHRFYRESRTVHHEPTVLGVRPGSRSDLTDFDGFLRRSSPASG
jgi:hypothetical protein